MLASPLERARLRGAALLVAAIVAFGGAPPVSAQPEGDKKEAVRRLARGDRQLSRGDRLAARGRIEEAFARFEAALAEYEAAYQAYPDPQIYFPIAQAEQRLGRFLDALQRYQDLLAEAKGLSDELRDQAQVHLDEVKKNLAALVLDVTPDGASVLVDGKEVGRSPMSQPVFVEPGKHSYEVTRDGYRAAEGGMDLAPGVETRRRIELERERPDVVRKPRRRDLAAERRRREALEAAARRPSAVPVWVGVGVTGALAVSAGITGFGALSKHDQFEDPMRGPAQREQARVDGERLAGITDILLGAAVVGAGVTAYYYFAIYRPRAARADRAEALGAERESALQLAPVLGDGVAGLAVSGTFW
jgi:tetratricopeptide (TPR) repeat protein